MLTKSKKAHDGQNTTFYELLFGAFRVTILFVLHSLDRTAWSCTPLR